MKGKLLPKMGDYKAIASLPLEVIMEGYNDANVLKRSIKQSADSLDEKAMKFIGFLVTIIIALTSALWILKANRASSYVLWLTIGEIVTCMISSCFLAFGVISNNAFHLPGERPEYFFWEKDLEWYRSLTVCGHEKFMAQKIKALSEDLEFNEKALRRMVINYRIAIWILVSLSVILGLVFLGYCLCI